MEKMRLIRPEWLLDWHDEFDDDGQNPNANQQNTQIL